MASHDKIPRFALDVQRTTRGPSRTLSNQRTPPTEHTKRDFEQKVAKVTKWIRVELGGGWRHTTKSPFRAGRSTNNKRTKPDTLKPANAANGTHKKRT